MYYNYYFYNVDVDECDEDTDGCSQTCTNTVGGFTCGCNDGYVLNVDGTTCDGMYMLCVGEMKYIFNNTKRLPFQSSHCNLLNIFKHSPIPCLYAYV